MWYAPAVKKPGCSFFTLHGNEYSRLFLYWTAGDIYEAVFCLRCVAIIFPLGLTSSMLCLSACMRSMICPCRGGKWRNRMQDAGPATVYKFDRWFKENRPVPRRSSELLTIQEVARYLNVNRITVYRLIRQKKIPPFKVGGQWRLKQEMIDAWLAEHSTNES
jgi:excisionase family DNA binding protein